MKLTMAATAPKIATAPPPTEAAQAAPTPTPTPQVAAPLATPENTPVPGGGRWGWDHLHACWVDSDAYDAAAELAANPSPTLE